MTTVSEDPVHTQADLERLWRSLMEPLGFGATSVWMLLIDGDGRPIPQLSEFAETAGPPEEDLLVNLGAVIAQVVAELGPGARVAFLRSRPGGAASSAADRAWARGLVATCRAVGVSVDVVHLATDLDLRPLTMDELAGAA